MAVWVRGGEGHISLQWKLRGRLKMSGQGGGGGRP